MEGVSANNSVAEETDAWFENLIDIQDAIDDDTPSVRVAILDTGINKRHPAIRKHIKSVTHPDRAIQEWRGFPDAKGFEPLNDLVGHGTQVTSIVLKIAPRSHLYIARVVDNDRMFSWDGDFHAAADVMFPSFKSDTAIGNKLGCKRMSRTYYFDVLGYCD